MKSRFKIPAFIAAIALLIGCSFLYINGYDDGTTSPTSAASTPVDPSLLVPASEGTLEIVTSAPKTFAGRLSEQGRDAALFSSNPPRDPAEDEVIQIAAQYQRPDKEKVDELLAMIPRLPEDVKVLAMESAASLIKDDQYLSYRSRLLQLSQSTEMRETVMLDALTRGEEVRLPTLVEMLGSTRSPEENIEIREILEAYLDHDYGPNPIQWVAPIKKWVAENSNE